MTISVLVLGNEKVILMHFVIYWLFASSLVHLVKKIQFVAFMAPHDSALF